MKSASGIPTTLHELQEISAVVTTPPALPGRTGSTGLHSDRTLAESPAHATVVSRPFLPHGREKTLSALESALSMSFI
jgi:hypothetical protein